MMFRGLPHRRRLHTTIPTTRAPITTTEISGTLPEAPDRRSGGQPTPAGFARLSGFARFSQVFPEL
jgi:hypothetical protein